MMQHDREIEAVFAAFDIACFPYRTFAPLPVAAPSPASRADVAHTSPPITACGGDPRDPVPPMAGLAVEARDPLPDR